MKTLIILSLAVCIGLFSCKKENAPAPKPVSQLVGNWRVVSDTTHSQWLITATNPTGEYTAIYTGTASDYYTFNSDGSFKYHQGNADNSGIYTFSDNKLKLVSTDAPSWVDPAVWQISCLTDHSVVLTNKLLGPGGPMTNIITLVK